MIGHRFFEESLTTADAWRSGVALWGWSAAALCLAVFGVLQDQLTERMMSDRSSETSDSKTISPLFADQSLAPAAGQIATVLAGVASVFSFGSLVLVVLLEHESTDGSYGITTNWMLPLMVLSGLAVGVFLKSQFGGRSQRVSSTGDHFSGTIVVVAGLLWLGWQLGLRWFTGADSQLVGATSISVVGCFAAELLRRDVKDPAAEQLSEPNWKSIWHQRGVGSSGVFAMAGLTIVAVSSLALMVGGWIPAVLRAESPQWFATVSIAVWMAVAAITCAWVGYRERSKFHCGIFAVLVPLIVFLVSPLQAPAEVWIWIQSAALSSFIVAMLGRFLINRGQNRGIVDSQFLTASQPALNGSLWFAIWCGLMTCVAAIVSVVIDDQIWAHLHNTIGIILSFVSVGMLLTYHRLSGTNAEKAALSTGVVSWPVAFSLMSGHVTLLLYEWVPPRTDAHWLIAIVWVVAASLSVLEYCRLAIRTESSDRFNVWHASLLIVAASTLMVVFSDATRCFVVGLIAATIGVVIVSARVVIAAWDKAPRREFVLRSIISTRLLGWFSMAMGVAAILRLTINTYPLMSVWTMVLAWVGGVALLWRSVAPDSLRDNDRNQNVRRRLADNEASAIVLLALMVEVVFLWIFPDEIAKLDLARDPFFWCRIGIGCLLALSSVFRVRRTGMLEVGLLTGLATITLVGMRIAVQQMTSPANVAIIGSLVAATGFAMFVFRTGSVCRIVNAFNQAWRGLMPGKVRVDGLTIANLNASLIRIGAVPVVASLSVCTWLLIANNGLNIVPLAICSIAMLAVAVGELGEQTNRGSLRDAAMTLGLTTIAMWASVNVVGNTFPLLALSTRWFVAWVVVAVALAVAIPKMLSQSAQQRWALPMRRGVMLAIVLSVGSLIATLAQEALVRTSGQTDLLNNHLVLGMASVLAAMSVVTTFAAIVSGPGFAYRDLWKLSDRQRSGLIVAAQALGGLTWFHLFLCKSPLASLGLRAYWPYVVMALAFASTGLTEWARRRGDEVLQNTLRQTALYLPLIPVIGFWLSGSLVTSFFGESNGGPWTFIQGKVTYQALLIAVAAYYGVVSFMWKSGRMRVMSIVFGNVALWVILVQTPGWSFLSHPQAWLIPPALCALAATHFYRDSLGSTATKSIRYAANAGDLHHQHGRHVGARHRVDGGGADRLDRVGADRNRGRHRVARSSVSVPGRHLCNDRLVKHGLARATTDWCRLALVGVRHHHRPDTFGRANGNRKKQAQAEVGGRFAVEVGVVDSRHVSPKRCRPRRRRADAISLGFGET